MTEPRPGLWAPDSEPLPHPASLNHMDQTHQTPAWGTDWAGAGAAGAGGGGAGEQVVRASGNEPLDRNPSVSPLPGPLAQFRVLPRETPVTSSR